MRHSLALLAVLTVAVSSRADDDVQKIIDQAIKAHGGAEKLGKFTTEATKAKGLMLIGGGITFTQESQLQLPDQLKDATVLNVGGQEVPITVVLDGEKGWVRANDQTKDMDAKLRGETLEGLYLAKLTRLVALKEKGVDLKPLGPVKIEGRDAFGIQVTSKGHRDVSLYFDKETGLMLKISRQAYDFEAMKDVAEDRIFSDYGEVEGLKVARKFVIHRDGKKFMDVEVVEAKLPGKLEASVFAKP